jgi:hypothetical protein
MNTANMFREGGNSLSIIGMLGHLWCWVVVGISIDGLCMPTDMNQNIVYVLLFGSFNDSLSPFQTNVACR